MLIEKSIPMKQTLLLTMIFNFLLINGLFCQSIDLQNPPSVLTGPASSVLLEAQFGVKNISASAKNIKVTRTVISEISGSENNICWGPTCYPPFVNTTATSVNIAPDETNTSFKGDYKPKGLTGSSIIKYCFFDENNPADETCTTIEYIAYDLINGAVESWETVGSEEAPEKWFTSNHLFSVGTAAQASVFKTTDSEAGNAAKLQSVKLTINPFPSLVPDTTGFMIYGNYDSVTGTIVGRPFAGQPASLDFYSKYSPAGADTFMISVLLTRWNSSTSERDTVANGVYTSSASESVYSYKTLNLVYYSNQLSDSIMVVVSSSGKSKPQLNSELFIDEMFLTEPASTGIKKYSLKEAAKIYPNPVSNTLYIDNIESKSAAKLNIYDITGKIIISRSLSDHIYNQISKVDVSDLTPGLYFYTIEGQKKYCGKFSVAK